MRRAIKKTILWNYGRTTWQYDVLCILILAFIFLTPLSWFSNGRERVQIETSPITRLIIDANSFSPESNEPTKLQRVRELTGNKNVDIVGWRELKNPDGRVTAYEIDVR